MTTSNVTPPAKSFFAIVMGKAVTSAANIETAFYNVAVNLAGLNASRQIESIIGGGSVDETRIKSTWENFLVHHANAGNMLWANTPERVDAIKAARGDARTALVRDYVYKMPKGTKRLVPGLERAKKVVTELVKDMITNHGGELHNLALMEKDGTDGRAIAERFNNFIKAEYPDSFSGMVELFKKAPKDKAKETPLEIALGKAKELNLPDLQHFVASIQMHLATLQADCAAQDIAANDAADKDETQTLIVAPVAEPVAIAA